MRRITPYPSVPIRTDPYRACVHPRDRRKWVVCKTDPLRFAGRHGVGIPSVAHCRYGAPLVRIGTEMVCLKSSRFLNFFEIFIKFFIGDDHSP